MAWFGKKRVDTVIVGGEKIEVGPVGVGEALEIVAILLPYIPYLENRIPELNAAFKNTRANRPQVLSSTIRLLLDEMKNAPGTAVKVFSLLIRRNPEWVAVRVTPKEFIEALVKLDKINNFYELAMLIKSYGVEIKYVVESKSTDNVPVPDNRRG